MNLLGAIATGLALGLEPSAIARCARSGQRGAGTLRAGERGTAVPGGGGLRPHAGRARARAGHRAQDHARPARRRVRLRRRSRPDQAPDHGRDRRALGRSGVGDLRQPALRATRGDHRRDPRGRAAGRRRGRAHRDSAGSRGSRSRRHSAWARTGDTIVIAGKGHETYQIIGAQTLAFDDREVARRLPGAGGRTREPDATLHGAGHRAGHPGRPGGRRSRDPGHRRVDRLTLARRGRGLLRDPRSSPRRSRVPGRCRRARRRLPASSTRCPTTCRRTCRWCWSRRPPGRSVGWPRFIARAFAIPVVAVTGSNGKTTTKELVAGVLATRWEVLKPERSFNNQWGLPLTLLRLGPEHQAAVLEIGTNARGEIAALAALARPDGGDRDDGRRPCTRSSSARSRACARRRRPRACAGADRGGRAERRRRARGRDGARHAGARGDLRSRRHRPRAGGRRGDRRRGAVCASRWRRAASGRPVTLALAGRHNVTNALAAAAAGVALGIPLAEIARGLGGARAGGRALRVAPGGRDHDSRRHLQRQPGVGPGRARDGRRASAGPPGRGRAGRHARAGQHQRRGAP